MMKRFFIDINSFKGGAVVIGGKEAHHIRDVARLKPGDRFTGFDGTGRTYTLRVKRISREIEADIEASSERGPNLPRVLLACAIPKKSKMDYIVEKATELGVSEVIPMVTERTIVKLNDVNNTLKLKRWRRIALEASKQCGRALIPKVRAAVDFGNAIKLACEAGYSKKIMPCLCGNNRCINSLLSAKSRNAAIFIGPEGDFSSDEIALARGAGVEPASLGPLVLKVDTACIYAVSVVESLCFYYKKRGVEKK